MAGKGGIDLILMDCNMPLLDGFEATRQIRQAELREGIPRRPILALTATAQEGDFQRCRDAGMDDLLSKPYTRAELAALLRRAVPAR